MARKSNRHERRDSGVSVSLTAPSKPLRDTRVARSTIRVSKALDTLSESLPSVIYQGRKSSAPLSKPADAQPAKPAAKVAKASKPDPVQDRRQLDMKPLDAARCKSRPKDSRRSGSGGGKPRDFVPWCG